MKKYCFLFEIISCVILFTNPLQAQITVKSTGEIGIHTDNPTYPIHIHQSTKITVPKTSLCTVGTREGFFNSVNLD